MERDNKFARTLCRMAFGIFEKRRLEPSDWSKRILGPNYIFYMIHAFYFFMTYEFIAYIRKMDSKIIIYANQGFFFNYHFFDSVLLFPQSRLVVFFHQHYQLWWGAKVPKWRLNLPTLSKNVCDIFGLIHEVVPSAIKVH